MTRQTLRDSHNQILGYREDCQDEIILRDANNVRIGKYSKLMDRTYDAGGKIVGSTGDILLTLLREKR